MMEERVLNRKFSSHLQNDCVQIFFLPVYFWLSNGYMTGEKLSFYIISVCLRLRFSWKLTGSHITSMKLPAKKFTFRVLGGKSRFLPEEGNRQCVCGNHHQHGYIKSYQRSKHEKGAIVDNAYVRLGHYVLLIDQT